MFKKFSINDTKTLFFGKKPKITNSRVICILNKVDQVVVLILQANQLQQLNANGQDHCVNDLLFDPKGAAKVNDLLFDPKGAAKVQKTNYFILLLFLLLLFFPVTTTITTATTTITITTTTTTIAII
uniref:Uncharacterized protein n=1 Tax=Wuchereria bancrofti TaxID=6293 RepID=A0AAF5Q4M7_WUCBA